MMRDITIAAAFAIVAGLLPAGLELAPTPGHAVAVLAPPWAPTGQALRIVAAADGLVVDAKGPIVIAESTDGNFIDRLYRAGAVLVLDARAVATCLNLSARASSSLKHAGQGL